MVYWEAQRMCHEQFGGLGRAEKHGEEGEKEMRISGGGSKDRNV